LKEEWKSIRNYEGLYECSNLGRVKSLNRVVDHPGGDLNLKGRILRPTRSRCYWTVKLFKGGRGKTFRVHRLVADIWIQGEGLVLHGGKGLNDNSVSNLRRGTQSDNMKDAYRRDKTRPTVGVKRSDGVQFDSIREAAESVGLTSQAVQRAVSDLTGVCAGYTWERIEC